MSNLVFFFNLEDVHVSFEGESSFLLQDVVGGEDHVQGVSDTNQYGGCIVS